MGFRVFSPDSDFRNLDFHIAGCNLFGALVIECLLMKSTNF